MMAITSTSSPEVVWLLRLKIIFILAHVGCPQPTTFTGRVDSKLVVNPPPDTFSPTGWKDGGGFDLLYAGNEHRALMIEMGGGPICEEQLSKALALAHKHVRRFVRGKGG